MCVTTQALTDPSGRWRHRGGVPGMGTKGDWHRPHPAGSGDAASPAPPGQWTVPGSTIAALHRRLLPPSQCVHIGFVTSVSRCVTAMRCVFAWSPSVCMHGCVLYCYMVLVESAGRVAAPRPPDRCPGGLATRDRLHDTDRVHECPTCRTIHFEPLAKDMFDSYSVMFNTRVSVRRKQQDADSAAEEGVTVCR